MNHHGGEDKRASGPGPESNGILHLTICFDSEGVRFFPEGDGSELAVRLAALIQLFHEYPKLVMCASGAPHAPKDVQ